MHHAWLSHSMLCASNRAIAYNINNTPCLLNPVYDHVNGHNSIVAPPQNRSPFKLLTIHVICLKLVTVIWATHAP